MLTHHIAAEIARVHRADLHRTAAQHRLARCVRALRRRAPEPAAAIAPTVPRPAPCG